MEQQNEEQDRRFVLTASIKGLGIGIGNFFGVSVFRILESAGCALAVILVVMSTPLKANIKPIIATIYALPVFLFCLLGVHGEDIFMYFFGRLKLMANGKKYTIGAPIKDSELTDASSGEKRKRKSKKETLLWRIADKLEE